MFGPIEGGRAAGLVPALLLEEFCHEETERDTQSPLRSGRGLRGVWDWPHSPRCEIAAEEKAGKDAPVARKDPLKITRLETFLVKPRWLFLKVHTNAGIVGLGEPIIEGRALTVAAAVKEIEPYLVGKDPRQVVHHWQAIYRHAFYRGGPILTSALRGIDQALWDIKGKALGVPVYELLGGPTRQPRPRLCPCADARA